MMVVMQTCLMHLMQSWFLQAETNCHTAGLVLLRRAV